MRNVRVWLHKDTVELLDKNSNGTPRAIFADKIIRYGIVHNKEIILEIIPNNKWGRPKKAKFQINTL